MNYLVRLKLADRPANQQEGAVFIGIRAVRVQLEQLKTREGGR
jgi:hypothetical protein